MDIVGNKNCHRPQLLIKNKIYKYTFNNKNTRATTNLHFTE